MKEILLLSFIFLSGCVSSKHISDADNAWVSDRLFGADRYYYCMSNKDPNGGTPKPLCFEAGMVNKGDKTNVHYRK